MCDFFELGQLLAMFLKYILNDKISIRAGKKMHEAKEEVVMTGDQLYMKIETNF